VLVCNPFELGVFFVTPLDRIEAIYNGCYYLKNNNKVDLKKVDLKKVDLKKVDLKN
jgi:hypothetical protein